VQLGTRQYILLHVVGGVLHRGERGRVVQDQLQSWWVDQPQLMQEQAILLLARWVAASLLGRAMPAMADCSKHVAQGAKLCSSMTTHVHSCEQRA